MNNFYLWLMIAMVSLVLIQGLYEQYHFSRFKNFFVNRGFTMRKEKMAFFLEKGSVGISKIRDHGGRNRSSSVQICLYRKAPELAFEPIFLASKSSDSPWAPLLLKAGGKLFPNTVKELVPADSSLQKDFAIYSLTKHDDLPIAAEKFILANRALLSHPKFQSVMIGGGRVELSIPKSMLRSSHAEEVYDILTLLQKVTLS